MFEAENIRDWRGHHVVDVDGDKVGELESVYVDTSTDQPAWAGVKTGFIGRQRITFVPLDGATVSPDHVRVRADKKTIKKAPSIDTDGELLASAEPELFAHYGLSYEPGTAGERRLARR